VTMQNQNIPKVRIEKSLNLVALSLILAAAVLLILVAVMLIPVVVMSILAVVKNRLFFLKDRDVLLVLFFRTYIKSNLSAHSCVVNRLKMLTYFVYAPLFNRLTPCPEL